MGYYIYKYENDNQEIGYIGLTTNLTSRINDHKIDKVGDSEFKNIYFFECENREQMKTYEYFLINKYLPPLNIQGKNLNIKIELDEPLWTPYIDTSPKEPVIKLEELLKSNMFLTSKKSKAPIELPDLMFNHSWKAIHFKIIYCNILKYRLTGSYIKNITEILKMCGLSSGGKTYKSYTEAVSFLQEQNIITDTLELINHTLMEHLTDEQLFSLISSKQISKYDFLYAELLNYFNFNDFTLSLNKMKEITGFDKTTYINQRAHPARINILWDMKLTYEIIGSKRDSDRVVCFKIEELMKGGSRS